MKTNFYQTLQLPTSKFFLLFWFFMGMTNITIGQITSTASGDWYNAGTWNAGVVPGPSDNVVINTVVYSNAVITRNAGTTTTITASGNLGVGAEYTNNGTTTINGSFQINNGGFANGNLFTYGAIGTLIFNSEVNDGVNGDSYWPESDGPKNVTVNYNGGITMNVDRTVTGIFQTASYVNNGGRLTITGIGRINEHGGIHNSSLIWGSTSTLIYYTNSNPFNRGYEWNGGTNPANVQLSNNTNLNYPSGGLTARTITGNLTIDANSTFDMGYGSPETGVQQLTVGNITLNGTLYLGNKNGGDLGISGNWTRNSNTGNFTHHDRAVFFIGNATQLVAVNGTELNKEIFAYLFAAGSGTLKLDATDVEVTSANGLTLSSSNSISTIDLNGRTLSLKG
ncbi:MAG: hypothetical protein ABI123_10965, partial [Ginsengibacter sp.]